MENVTLVCQNCGKIFSRRTKEHKRTLKKNRKIFCSLSCSAVLRNQEFSKGNPANLIIGSEIDELSPFRWHLKVSRQRKQWKNNLTLEYLKELWDNQKGKCPYLKIDIKLPRDTGKNCDGLDFASLDRIDSSKGYIQGNVEFVSIFINYAKSTHSREQVQDILQKFKDQKNV